MHRNKIKFHKRSFFKNQLKEKNLSFGRFSDRDKSDEQLMYLQEADNLYSKAEYIDAIEKILMFISDEKTQNVAFEKGKELKFEIKQGSKKITGITKAGILKAYAELLSFSEDNIDLYLNLLEQNHNLKFTKFLIKKNTVYAEINLFVENCSNEVLYYALRELCIIADKFDDYLEIKFKNLTPLNKSHILEMPDKEFETKTSYIKKWITDGLKESEKVDNVSMSGAKSFILLSSIYKIFYLVVPEGELNDILSEVEKFFFESTKTPVEKNKRIEEILREISNWDKLRFRKSLYKVAKTFPEKMPSKTTDTLNFIKQEIEKIYWYETNGYIKISMSILDYIAGYIDYNFGNIPILNDMFLIYWEIMYKQYFYDLGIKKLPYERNYISYFLLNKSLWTINASAAETYPDFFFNIKHLDLTDNYRFAKSFFQEILNTNFKISKFQKS